MLGGAIGPHRPSLDLHLPLGDGGAEVNREGEWLSVALRMREGRFEEEGAHEPAKRADHVPIGIARPSDPLLVPGHLQIGSNVEWVPPVCHFFALLFDFVVFSGP